MVGNSVLKIDSLDFVIALTVLLCWKRRVVFFPECTKNVVTSPWCFFFIRIPLWIKKVNPRKPSAELEPDSCRKANIFLERRKIIVLYAMRSNYIRRRKCRNATAKIVLFFIISAGFLNMIILQNYSKVI